MDQVGPDEHVEVGRPAEGAAALCGSGESHHVGDRSRADCGGPVQPDVGVVCRVGKEIGIGGFPWQGSDDRSLCCGGADGFRGSTRVGR